MEMRAGPQDLVEQGLRLEMLVDWELDRRCSVERGLYLRKPVNGLRSRNFNRFLLVPMVDRVLSKFIQKISGTFLQALTG